MTGAITWDQIITLIPIVGAIGGMWWFLQGQITAGVKSLDEYKLHVAESYLSKSSIKGWRDEILTAVAGLKEDLRHLSNRIDGMHR